MGVYTRKGGRCWKWVKLLEPDNQTDDEKNVQERRNGIE